MTEPNTETNKEQHTAKRATASKKTAPAARTAKRVAEGTDDAASAVKAGAERSAEAAGGASQGLARGVEAGRRTLVATTGQVAATAKTAWTVIANRKLVVAGVSAGVTALTTASYAVGRRSGRRNHGPVTRLTGGRI
ncbi:hypothetical protein AB0G67_44510 [Streptomyces sp. NPDC021056]|uniref:hypothetical protein n=1 Tax=Streptomyces sp. NPDC021056 TaxID=3155012 RepID=UPI0033F28FD1